MKGNERVRNFLKKLYARETSILKSTLKISIFHPLVFLNFIQIVIRDKVKIEIHISREKKIVSHVSA